MLTIIRYYLRDLININKLTFKQIQNIIIQLKNRYVFGVLTIVWKMHCFRINKGLLKI
ncbi:hypothetical protein KsCSTR_11840 [Candidatus Kuenenia stuttgartiensis]|uniref:Uncharacterized protein n=1 Tax=Kuenenia stuttgartiensis TaxID=174633 RepID=Q1PYC7_KUEST|nr:hypothetical protein KsCSTR_11840 [Candidatus Kuenenia stuttgartiensis]CAJ72083.1 unknown protein [Candidatus Kuenenia stuttgartiensis]